MATKTFFLNSTLADYSEEEFNYLQKFLLQEGVLNSTGADYNDFADLKVTQNGGGNMSVNVAAGVAVVDTQRGGVSFKVFVSNQASANVAIAANSSGANRVGALILRLSRTVEPNALMSNVASLYYVPGTSTSALLDADIQSAIGTDDFIRLANITVANNATQILTANIADTRVRCYSTDATVPNPTIIKFRQLAADPTSPAEGEMWYNTTDNILRYYNGASTINIQASVYTGGNGIDVTAGVITVNLDTGSGLEFNSAKISVKDALFGDGSDGNVTISVNTTLTGDKYYNNLTVNNGVVLKTGGYRIYVKGTLTNNGTIQNSGDDGVGNVAGAGGGAGSLLGGGAGGAGGYYSASYYGGGGGGGGGVLFIFAKNIAVQGNMFAKGGNGGNALGSGGSYLGNNAAGTAVANGLAAANGGKGGDGGGGLAGGAVTNVRTITEKSIVILNLMIDPKNLVGLGGGGGGSGGQYNNGINCGWGGGGGGGGTVILVYKNLVTAGTISVAGGTKGVATGTCNTGGYIAYSTDGAAGKQIVVQV